MGFRDVVKKDEIRGGAGGADVAPRSAASDLKRAAGGMSYDEGARAMSPEGGAWKPAPVAPSPDDIVRDAYTLGGESRYQVTAEQAMGWIEQRMDHVPAEHKYAWQQARLIVNRRLR